MIKWIVALVAILSLNTTSAGGISDDLQSFITESVNPYRSGPGLNLLIYKNGESLLHFAFGMASLELDVATETNHAYSIGSISKQFTAAAILKLHETGELDIKENVGDYLALDNAEITIENLLTHTSGLSDVLRNPDIINVYALPYTRAERLDYLIGNVEQNFVPGEKYEYSNTNYQLLSFIIEKVTGQDYASYMEKTIFAPLGMEQTFIGSSSLVHKGMVKGYNPGRDGGMSPAVYLPFDLDWAQGAGSAISTVSDLLHWLQSLAGDQLISEESRNRMLRIPDQERDHTTENGFGFHGEKLAGRMVYKKSGAINGFQSNLFWSPPDDLVVIGLTNRVDAPPTFVYDIGERMLKESQ